MSWSLVKTKSQLLEKLFPWVPGPLGLTAVMSDGIPISVTKKMDLGRVPGAVRVRFFKPLEGHPSLVREAC